MSTSELNAWGNPAMDYHPVQGVVEILLVTSHYRNWDKLQPDEPVGLYACFFRFATILDKINLS